MNKRELLDKIYAQKHECENNIKKIDKNIENKNIDEMDYRYAEGRKTELEDNVIFCNELIDAFLDDN